MKKQVSSAIVIICIFTTFGTTYAVVNAFKDQEITDLKTQYELDLNTSNDLVDSLTEQINNLQLDQEDIIGKWHLTYAIFSGRPDPSIYFYPNGSWVYNNYGNETSNGIWEFKNGTLIFANTTYYISICENQNWLFLVQEDPQAFPADSRFFAFDYWKTIEN